MGKHRDWSEIEQDYLESGLSLKQLAEKYAISIDTLKKISSKQGWAKKRSGKETKAERLETALAQMAPENGTTGEIAPVVQLYPDTVRDSESDAQRFNRIVNEMMDRVEDAICCMDVRQPGAVKLMTGALKDLRDLKGLNKTALDIEEQKARIEKLRSDVRIVDDTEEYGVIILPEIEEVVPPD